MINRNISQIIKNGYKKNYREYFALKNKLYPQFVFDSTLKTLRDEIPVFTLHSVNPKKFEEQLVFLSENNYNTINADNLYEYLIGTRKIEERTIVLTFDDGWKNLYTVVYPLLKKYAFKAVCFLIANLIPEKESETFEIDTEKVNNNFYPDSNILCNWDEIAEMENSGVIDFQSHSMNHYLISISPVIKDFIFPNYDGYALNLDIPLLQFDDKENYSRSLALGTPIYENDSRFSGKKRFFDDEKLRDECTDFVKN
ncbi:MAG: polysaccharide deacetylase family protein, partial [Ignavibacteriae bacterium]|nr:polysaccharide deacetylase family protein [Ignavibacteriota bacterium]